MRISWVSNAPWANTGYGNQTRLFTPRIQGLGHEIQITAFYGLEGGVLSYGGPNGPIPVYPRAYHPYGVDVMGAHAAHFKADVIISLIDAWVIEPQMIMGGLRWAPWFPIDHEGIPEAVLKKVQAAWSRIVYSRHAERLVKAAGLDCYYVPHGVDTKAFLPVADRAGVRKNLNWPIDKFIVGMVAANKGNPSRKAFPENLRAFSELKKKHTDVMMYLHTVPGLENGGVDLIQLCNNLGLTTGFIGRCNPNDVDVLFNDQYQAMIGLGDGYMNAVYNAMDVHLLVSMGEGFGLPIVEAQAAGCPVIVGDWTAMGELCFSGWKVAKGEAEPFFTPLNSWEYVPHSSAIAERLEAAYRMRDNQDYRKRARDGALAYDADKVVEKYWQPALDDMAKRIDAWKPEEDKQRWIKVGLYNPDGSIDIPDKATGDALRIWKDGRQKVIQGGFTNPLDLKFVDPDGLEWLLMREFERDYATDELQLDENSVVVDIGAHVGVVSMSLAKKYGCKVYAFEPDPENWRRLRANLIANDLMNRVIDFNIAVTKDGRDVWINKSPDNSGGHSIYGKDGNKIESFTLDKILSMTEFKRHDIDLLKIDCEGAEYEILENADLSKVKAIRGEFHGPKGRELLEKVKEQVPDTKVTLQGAI